MFGYSFSFFILFSHYSLHSFTRTSLRTGAGAGAGAGAGLSLGMWASTDLLEFGLGCLEAALEAAEVLVLVFNFKEIVFGLGYLR